MNNLEFELSKYLDFISTETMKPWIKIVLEILYKKDIDISKIDLNEKKLFEYINTNDTSNIYLLKRKFMQEEFINMFKPNNLEVLESLISLFRPSPMAHGILDEYLENKSKKIDSKIDELKTTYDVVLYQEQIESILQRVFEVNEVGSKIILAHLIKDDDEKLESYKSRFKENSELFDKLCKYAPASYSHKIVRANAKLCILCVYLQMNFADEYNLAITEIINL